MTSIVTDIDPNQEATMKTAHAKSLSTLAASVLAALTIVGCASPSRDVPEELAPRRVSELQADTRFASHQQAGPTVAVALGGGGLRGFAHLGVLQALEEEGLKPRIIVGTSAGAVVGSAYASGLSPREIAGIARDVKLSSLIDFTFSKSGIMRGDNIASWIDSVTGDTRIEAYPIRFGAVATDLESGAAVLLDRGPAGRSVQASAAVPGINVPVAYKGGHLVDGGISNLVPVRFARAMGADVVIAVDIFCTGPGSQGTAVPSILLRTMRVQSCLVAAPEMAEADVLVAPAISISGMSAKDEQERAVVAGYQATRALMPQIRSRIAAKARGDGRTNSVAAETSKVRLEQWADAGASLGGAALN
jgi:NTE family protein